MDKLVEYTIPMALEDFLPVLLSVIGLYFLSRMVSHMDKDSGRMAYLGTALVAVGGFSKALWKLIMALTIANNGGSLLLAEDAMKNTAGQVAWLDNNLFLFMAPGFTLLAFALWYGQKKMYGGQRPPNVWLVPGIISLAAVGAAVFLGVSREGRAWFFVLLAVTTVANFAVSGLAIRQCRRQNLTALAGLFALNVFAILMLQGMARVPDQSIPLQWTQQIINTLSNGAFAFAAYKLGQDTAVRLGVVSPEPQPA